MIYDMYSTYCPCIIAVSQIKKKQTMLSDALLDPISYKRATSQGQTMIVTGVENYPNVIKNDV